MNYDLSKYELEKFDVYQAYTGRPVCNSQGIAVKIVDYDHDGSDASFELCTIKSEAGDLYNGVGEMLGGEEELFHPVLRTKTKRIPFDASRVNEEGVKVVFRGKDYTFEQILASDLRGNHPLLVKYRYADGTKDTVRLCENGKGNPVGEDHKLDLLLEVPDTEPVLPSMQEVAEKTEAKYIWMTDGRIDLSYGKQTGIFYHAEEDVERLKCIGILMNVARLMNDGWEPDHTFDQPKYYIQWSPEGLSVEFYICPGSEGEIFFRSEEAANYAREILNSWEANDAILLRALGVK